MAWTPIDDSWVVVPSQPRAVIHFLGGAFIAAAPQLTYPRLLDACAEAGLAVVATPFVNTFDHADLARQCLQEFERVLARLEHQGRLPRDLPVFGLGHSMGSKLHLLIGSLFPVERLGNALLAFNNFSARRSIPFFSQLAPALEVDAEFSPTPARTLRLIDEQYRVAHNLLVRFRTDDLDQSRELAQLLGDRFPRTTELLRLPGTHLTPMGQSVQLQSGFDLLDQLGRAFNREVYRDLDRLQESLLDWLEDRLDARMPILPAQ
jgi:hypothetical protein